MHFQEPGILRLSSHSLSPYPKTRASQYPQYLGHISCTSETADTKDLDWALCQIQPSILESIVATGDVNRFSLAGVVRSEEAGLKVRHMVEVPSEDVPIFVVTSFEQPIKGTVDAAPCFYRMPGKRHFLKVFALHLEHRLSE